MKTIRLLAWFFFGLTIGAFATASAIAETIPAVPLWAVGGLCKTGTGASLGDACAAASGSCAATFNGSPGFTRTDVFTFSGGVCNYETTIRSDSSGNIAGQNSGTNGGVQIVGCPPSQGWTLSGNTCTRPDCVSPAVRQSDGSCLVPLCPDGQTRGTSGTGQCKTQCASSGSAGGQTGEQYQTGSTSPGSICGTDGCGYSPADCIGVNNKSYCWAGKSSGASCNSSARNPDGSDHQTAEQQAAAKTTAEQNTCITQGKCPITINGVVTCTQCATTSNNSNGSTTGNGTTTNTNTSTNCTLNGSLITCQTTTTTTGGGSGDGTTTTAGTDTVSNYCAQNPGATVCQGRQLTDCDKYPNSAGCKELGNAPENHDLITQDAVIPSSLTPVTVNATAGVCPADIPLPRGMAFEWDGICMFAEGLRPVILSLAWLAAGFIVFGVRTDA